jgi:RNA 3'-terminal phosphate cyclase (ATP)
MVSSGLKEAIAIDGSLGEGGGQVLRSSLALALITGKSFAMRNIRQRRAKPGMMAQHLKAVEAASAVGMARVEGARLGSHDLVFEPVGIRSGEFHFDIGTAGSTSLVLQTILLPLSFAEARSTVTLIGGTHVPSSCTGCITCVKSASAVNWNWKPPASILEAAGAFALSSSRFRIPRRCA